MFDRNQQRPSGIPPEVPAPPGGPGSFGGDNNDFGLAMYGLLRQQRGNLFFSPFSIRVALGMTYAGARGETAAQMRGALRFSSEDTLHSAFAEIVGRLSRAGDGAYEIRVANSLWGQEGAPLQPGFLNLIARYYSGGMKLVDFRSGTEAVRTIINRWVEDNTKQKIREFIPSGGLDTETRLVLVNAVCFKGRWEQQFNRESTRDGPFSLEGGGTVQAPLMHRHDEVRYLRASGYQAVDLDYEGGDLSMLVLLPDRKDGLRDFEKTLSAGMLRDCVEHMVIREVKLFLPRFRITWGTADLGGELTALGMTCPFNQSRADFSGINGHQPPHEEALFISAVFHKAFVDVNEEGTEAAAATGVGMPLAAPLPSRPLPVPVFRADHPFLFAIRDRKSGSVLFLGRVTDPR